MSVTVQRNYCIRLRDSLQRVVDCADVAVSQISLSLAWRGTVSLPSESGHLYRPFLRLSRSCIHTLRTRPEVLVSDFKALRLHQCLRRATA